MGDKESQQLFMREAFCLLGEGDHIDRDDAEEAEITPDSALAALTKLGFVQTKEEVLALTKSLDSGKKEGKRLLLDQAVRTLDMHLKYADCPRAIADALKVMDKYGSGGMAIAELRHQLRCGKEENGLTGQDIKEMMELLSADGSGVISTSGLLEAMTK